MQSCRLSPARALVAPPFLVALLLLGVNDHLLKGSGLLPGALTGKLSDFAGLFVAPIVLAVMVRVRTRRGLWACAVAVAAGFSAIKLSPAAAGFLEAVTAAVGVPWRVWVDPSDLLALPMTAASVAVLGPLMGEPLRLPRLELVLGVAAGAACVATGAPVCTSCQSLQSLFARAALVNETGETVTVRVRPVRDSVLLDCNQLAPVGTSLSGDLFGAGFSMTVDAGLLIPLDRGLRGAGNRFEDFLGRPDGGCDALLVEGEGESASIQPTVVMLPAELQREQVWMVPSTDGGRPVISVPSASLVRGERGSFALSAQTARMLVEPRRAPAPATGACSIPPPSVGLGWSAAPTQASLQVGRVETGPDGCVQLKLLGDAGPAQRITLCAPVKALDVQPADLARITSTDDGLERTFDLELTRAGGERRLIRLWQSPQLPSMPGLVLSSVPVAGCEGVGARCGSFARPLQVLASLSDGTRATLSPGDSASATSGKGVESSVWLVRAEEVPVAEDTCSDGPTRTGTRFETATLIKWQLDAGVPDAGELDGGQ